MVRYIERAATQVRKRPGGRRTPSRSEMPVTGRQVLGFASTAPASEEKLTSMHRDYLRRVLRVFDGDYRDRSPTRLASTHVYMMEQRQHGPPPAKSAARNGEQAILR